MPVYDYRAQNTHDSCPYCCSGFEIMRRLADPPLTHCPKCNAPIIKIISAPALGRSESKLDDRAKAAGFHKLKRVDQGAFEKLY